MFTARQLVFDATKQRPTHDGEKVEEGKMREVIYEGEMGFCSAVTPAVRCFTDGLTVRLTTGLDWAGPCCSESICKMCEARRFEASDVCVCVSTRLTESRSQIPCLVMSGLSQDFGVDRKWKKDMDMDFITRVAVAGN